jgi:N-acetylglutamate synthase/N-acetylornithine aminotransferase
MTISVLLVDDHALIRQGLRRAFEATEIVIELSLGLGSGDATAWGTDLSADYVRINADYTT